MGKGAQDARHIEGRHPRGAKTGLLGTSSWNECQVRSGKSDGLSANTLDNRRNCRHIHILGHMRAVTEWLIKLVTFVGLVSSMLLGIFGVMGGFCRHPGFLET
jgi:hypothetical protein